MSIPDLDAIFDSVAAFIPADVAPLMPLIMSTEFRTEAVERVLGTFAADDVEEDWEAVSPHSPTPMYRHAFTTDGQWLPEEDFDRRLMLHKVRSDVDQAIRRARRTGRVAGYVQDQDKAWYRITGDYWIIHGGGPTPDRVVLDYGVGFNRKLDNALILFSKAEVLQWIERSLQPLSASAFPVLQAELNNLPMDAFLRRIALSIQTGLPGRPTKSRAALERFFEWRAANGKVNTTSKSAEVEEMLDILGQHKSFEGMDLPTAGAAKNNLASAYRDFLANSVRTK